jgi:hypothetical protein
VPGFSLTFLALVETPFVLLFIFKNVDSTHFLYCVVCCECLEQGKEAISREIDSKIISQLAQTSDSDIKHFLSVLKIA